VRDALSRLAERDRALIVRRYYEGWSLKEVGEEIGLSSMGVLARERHILRRLRAELAGALGERC
jgi:RNA polymerase sigma factor (sigma-70 family)